MYYTDDATLEDLILILHTRVANQRMMVQAMLSRDDEGFLILHRIDACLHQLFQNKAGFNPAQPRVPAGHSEGGQWVREGTSRDTLAQERIDKAVEYLRRHAKPKSTGYCAQYVRIALNAGNILTQTSGPPAREYGPILLKAGFRKVEPRPKPSYQPLKGDIAVIQPYPGGRPEGHIQMYDGRSWISDFIQPRSFWPSANYEYYKPTYEIYRYQ